MKLLSKAGRRLGWWAEAAAPSVWRQREYAGKEVSIWESKDHLKMRWTRAEGTGRGVGFRKELGITFLPSQGRDKRPDGESENCWHEHESHNSFCLIRYGTYNRHSWQAVVQHSFCLIWCAQGCIKTLIEGSDTGKELLSLSHSYSLRQTVSSVDSVSPSVKQRNWLKLLLNSLFSEDGHEGDFRYYIITQKCPDLS